MSADDMQVQDGGGVEAVARALTVARMEHYGFTPEDLEALADGPKHEENGCEFDWNHMRWDCTDDLGQSNHPNYDTLDETAEFVMWMIEHPALRAVLASQPAPTVTDEAVEAGVDVADAMNADAWIVVPDRNTGEPSQQQVPLSHLVEGIITAALPHLIPAQSGDGVAEAVAAQGEKIATAIKADDWFDPTNVIHHVPDFREGIEYATARHVRIARTTTEEADHG